MATVNPMKPSLRFNCVCGGIFLTTFLFLSWLILFPSSPLFDWFATHEMLRDVWLLTIVPVYWLTGIFIHNFGATRLYANWVGLTIFWFGIGFLLSFLFRRRAPTN